MFWRNLLEKFMISTRKLRHYRINFIEWSCLFLGLLLIFRYRWLIDDSFIYFRYIDNFLFLKIGLVYNQGEFVEGFSSPAWLILLSFFRMFHINFWMIVQIIGGLSFVLFWILLIKLNRKLCSGHTIINFPLIYIVSHYGVLCYFTSGLETPLVLILAITYALYILNPSSKLLQVMLAFSPLGRHELILPLIICFIWGWLREKRFPKLLFILTAIFVGLVLLVSVIYIDQSLWPAIAAIGTIGAVVWAIYSQGILARLNRPILELSPFELESPHLRQVPFYDPTGKQIDSGYALSIQLKNTGKAIAKNAQRLITNMGRFKHGKWQIQRPWIAAPIRWALDIPAEVGADEPTEEKDLVPHRPYVFNLGILRTNYPDSFVLKTILMPGNQDVKYGPGEFCFELKVFAEGAKPARKYVHIKWDGGCTDDFDDVKKKIKVSLKDHSP